MYFVATVFRFQAISRPRGTRIPVTIDFVAYRRRLPEHSRKNTFRNIQENTSGTSQENTFRNTQGITSEILERLHLLPESQKKTSETSRRLLPEYPGDCPQGAEETAHGTLGRSLTEHSRKTLSGTYRRSLPERLERKCAKEWIFKGFYE